MIINDYKYIIINDSNTNNKRTIFLNYTIYNYSAVYNFLK